METNKIVDTMFENDAFSKWLGIEIISKEPGSIKLRLTVREEMVNGLGITHGAITYAMADSALAFSSNSHGRRSVSVETSISHVKPSLPGDVLTAETTELHSSNKIGIYDIRILNQYDHTIALFKGTVYRTSKTWDV